MAHRIRRTRTSATVAPAVTEAPERPAPKYVVYPGYVISKTDSDRHFIPSDYLMFLYGVKREECIVITSSMPPPVQRQAEERAAALKCIPLYPKTNGDYTLPTAD